MKAKGKGAAEGDEASVAGGGVGAASVFGDAVAMLGGHGSADEEGTVYGGGSDDDAATTAGGAGGGAGPATYSVVDGVALMEEARDSIVEKSAGTRERALRQMATALKASIMDEYMADKYDAVAYNVLGCAKRGKWRESALASHVVALTALAVGIEHDDLVESVQEPLRFAVDRGKSPEAKACALKALVTTGFICSTEDSHTLQLQDLCETTFKAKRTPPTLRATALSCWALCTTALPTAYVAGECKRANLPAIRAMLDHPDQGVRMAAGDCLAVLYDAQWNLDGRVEATEGAAGDGGDGEAGDVDGVAADAAPLARATSTSTQATAASGATPSDRWDTDEEWDEDGTGEGGSGTDVESDDEGVVAGASQGGTSKLSKASASWDWEEVIRWGERDDGSRGATPEQWWLALETEVVERVTRLAKDNARHRSRRDRKATRSVFRDVLDTIRSGFEPETTVRIRVASASLLGWTSRIQVCIACAAATCALLLTCGCAAVSSSWRSSGTFWARGSRRIWS